MKNKKIIISFLIISVFILTVLIVKHFNPDYSRMGLAELSMHYSNMSEQQARQLIQKTRMETWSIREIEKFLLINDNVHTYAWQLPQEVIEKRINTRLFHLKVNGKVYPASAVFISNGLLNQYRLDSGDDTVHIMEFPETYQVMQANDGDRIEIELKEEFAEEFALSDLKFYQVDPFEIFDDGYKNAKELLFKDNHWVITKEPSGREQLIFTILKGAGELYYKKLVWVVRCQ